jgi:hypothetical protein
MNTKKPKRRKKAASWLGWHFADESECLRYGDGRKIVVGKSHTVNCEPKLCEAGLHASKTVMEALRYAPGPILYHVRLSGKIVHGDDKSCATKRTYIAKINADKLLREFARKCALQVIHLWNCPRIVKDYLETGNENLRAAAWAAAGDAAWAAAGDAARAAAGAAAGAAAWAAAWAAAGDAAWAAAGDAARNAARAAAGDAARAAQSKLLDSMVLAAMKKRRTKRR